MPDDSLNINVNAKGIKQNSFDAIVIGSGISGGWAAKELCDFTSKPGCTQAKKYMPVQDKYIGCVSYKKGEKAIV